MASELWHMHACVFVCDFLDASTHLVHSHLPTAREPHIHSPAHTRPQACSHKLHKCSLHSILNRFAVGATPRIYPFFLSLAERGNRERISLSIFQSLFGCGFANTCRVQCRCQRNHSDNNSAHPPTKPWCLHDSGGSGQLADKSKQVSCNQQTPALARIATTHGLCCSLTSPRSLFSKSF